MFNKLKVANKHRAKDKEMKAQAKKGQKRK